MYFSVSLCDETIFSSIDVAASRKGSSIDLNLKNVFQMLYPARASWFNIGIILEVDINTLQAFEKDSDSVGETLVKVINHWLNNSIKKSWRELAEAMGSDIVNREDIKFKIMEMIERKSLLLCYIFFFG